jgi:hypothetical protein
MASLKTHTKVTSLAELHITLACRTPTGDACMAQHTALLQLRPEQLEVNGILK